MCRIGIRKRNELILESIDKINLYFNNYFKDDLNKQQDSKQLVLEYSFRQFCEKNISINKKIRIVKGKCNVKGKSKDAYSFVWDLDCYCRFNDNIEIQKT